MEIWDIDLNLDNFDLKDKKKLISDNSFCLARKNYLK